MAEDAKKTEQQAQAGSSSGSAGTAKKTEDKTSKGTSRKGNQGKGNQNHGNGKGGGQDSSKHKGVKKYQGKGNPIEWYVPDTSLLNNTCNLSFSYILGRPINLNYPIGDIELKGYRNSLPGVMVITTVDTIGNSTDPRSPVNISGRTLYTKIREKSAVYTQYEMADLMLYVLSMNEIYSLFVECSRDVKILQKYNTYNKYEPDGVLRALGYVKDENDLELQKMISELPEYIIELRGLAYKINTYNVPDDFAIIERHSMLYGNIFRDHESQRSQNYIFRHGWTRIFKPYEDKKGGSLQPKHLKGLSLKDKIKLLKEMVDAVYYDDDMNRMSGDLLKAYADSAMVSLTAPEFGQLIEPVFDKTVLLQIQNITSYVGSRFTFTKLITGGTNVGYGIYLDVNSLAITQENGVIISDPRLTGWDTQGVEIDRAQYRLLLPRNTIITTTEETPKPDFVMEATRLCTHLDYDAPNLSKGSARIICASEMVTDLTMYSYKYGDSGTPISVRTTLQQFDNFVVPEENSKHTVEYLMSVMSINNELIQSMANMSHFKWHPVCYNQRTKVKTAGIPVSNHEPIVQCGDLENIAYLDKDRLRNIHEVALLGLFKTVFQK